MDVIEDVENCTYCASGMGCYHHSSKWMSEKIKDLQSRLNIAVECLKFYADTDNWNLCRTKTDEANKDQINAINAVYASIMDDSSGFSFAGCHSYVGGKRAREVLKQIQGEENERK